MDHKQILKMIEEVSPDDTAKMDEIDARVFCYVDGVEFIQMYERSLPYPVEFVKKTKSGHAYVEALYNDHRYTRSLDALKEIESKDWLNETMEALEAVKRIAEMNGCECKCLK